MRRRNQKATDLLSIVEAAALLGVQVRTMRGFANRGLIASTRGPALRRFFAATDLEALRRARIGKRPGAVVLYARVSSRRQAKEGDLDRQMARLVAFAGAQKIIGEYQDVGSGLAEHRRGLLAALEACAKPEVTTLVVTHRDRLARFGTVAIEHLLGQLGVKLVVIGEEEVETSVESDLVRDMLAIVTSFSGRLYGQRSARAQAVRRALAAELRLQPDAALAQTDAALAQTDAALAQTDPTSAVEAAR